MSVRLDNSLEKELQGLNDEIRRLDGETAERHTAAERLVAEIRESGVNPFMDTDAFSRVDAAYTESDGPRQQAAELRTRRERVLMMMGQRAPAPIRRSHGDFVAAFFESPEYRRLHTAGAFESERARVEIPPAEFLSREDTLRMFAANGSLIGHATADVGAIVPDDQRLFPPVPIPVRPVRLPELITMDTTDSDTVEYVEETTRTDVAVETAPGTASAEATYVYTNRTALVRDISHWTPAHKRNLADAGQVRGLLEGRLRSGVERRFETQIVSGDGAGENLRGILNTTGIGTVAKGGTEPRHEAIHRAITTIRLALFGEPDAIGLHPTDYEEVVLEKDANGNYLLGPASQQTSRTVWGFPAVITAAFSLGTGLAGNFREGAIAWLRSGVAISASDSHANMFTERRVALLAEMRAAFAAWQPKAFCTITGI